RHISHELKTPLANIREGTELLMDGAVGELDSNQREVTAILRENGIKLQRMIENLLSFSAWQTSSVGLEATEFRLRPLVKQVLENQQLTLLSQRVRLDVRVEDVTLVADRGKIRLILENLVSNAVKYSPKGGTIHLRARAAGAQLVLDVADSGPGIPREDREHVFEAFYTGRAARGATGGALAAAAVLIGAGCSSLGLGQRAPTPSPVIKTASAGSTVLGEYLLLLQKLVQGTPSQQAEIVANAQRDYDVAPTPSRELKLALILGTPGHPVADLPRAQGLLRELMANPEMLLPVERALTFLELSLIDDHLTLESENRRLQNDAVRADQQRMANA